MSIPESVLGEWSKQGSTSTAASTADAVRSALLDVSSPTGSRNTEVYLQGSYRNDTNISAESDVDVVIQLNDAFYPDFSRLDTYQAEQGRRTLSDAAYTYDAFYNEVLQTLRHRFGAANVSLANKCIKIAPTGGRLPADVVVCFEYRLYTRFQSISDTAYIPGIAFFSKDDSRRIINFPKPHYLNGVDKNSPRRTDGWFKPTVRMFKNARSALEDRRLVAKGSIPSYFLQCLIFNAADHAFGASLKRTFEEVLRSLGSTDFSRMLCQNGVTQLFGESPEQWDLQSAYRFVIALTDLYCNW